MTASKLCPRHERLRRCRHGDAGTAGSSPPVPMTFAMSSAPRGRDGEPTLEQRGYTHIDTGKSSTAAYSYWWNNGRRPACA
jgi:hypothetical protein